LKEYSAIENHISDENENKDINININVGFISENRVVDEYKKDELNIIEDF